MDVIARSDIDPLLGRLLDLVLLVHLGQRRLLMKAAIVHSRRLGNACPADLLYPIIKLNGMAIWIVNVDVPVTTGHVSPDPLDSYFVRTEELCRFNHFVEGPDLPGNLVDRDIIGHFLAKHGA